MLKISEGKICIKLAIDLHHFFQLPNRSWNSPLMILCEFVIGVDIFIANFVFTSEEGGVRVCGDAVLRYFSCGFAVIFILTRGIAVSKH